MLQKFSNRFINIAIVIISILIPVLIVALLKIAPPANVSFELHFFPKFNAFVNSGTTLCLLVGFYFIKQKNTAAHRAAMMSALFLSILFLLSYIIYHTLKAEDSKFGGIGWVRYLYFFILITHILLSAVVLPLVLKTFSFAFQGNFIAHKKWAKYTFPLWLYVAVSGVLVYIFMAPYY